MRRSILTGLVAVFALAASASAQTGYIYEPYSFHPAPPAYAPAYGYGYGYYNGFVPYSAAYYSARSYGYGFGLSGYSRALPPYGFGSPYYSGYNDPYFHSYGPGIREFLYFGGADFYGW